MAKIAIAIDDWKLNIFSKALTAAGFTFVENPGVTDDTLLLSVKTMLVNKLAEVVKDANATAAIEKLKRGE